MGPVLSSIVRLAPASVPIKSPPSSACSFPPRPPTPSPPFAVERKAQIMSRVAIPLAFVVILLVPELPHASRGSDGATADPGWSELTSRMEKMHLSMGSVAPSGDTDVDFVRLMLPHHQAAIDMAKTELSLGKNPQLRRLAQEIITDQQSEIDLMELWLKKHAPERQKTGKSSGSSVKED